MRIVALAGGVGGAKMAHGLAQILAPHELTVIVNTADDFEHLGLHISPDLDTVCYTLAGMASTRTGWGRHRETWHALTGLEELGGPTWFRLGDRDLATHLERTRRLRIGEPLNQIVREFCQAWGVEQTILPMTDAAVRTIVRTNEGDLEFQAYFVHRRCEPEVTGFEFRGVEQATAAPGVMACLENADGIVICPSNPWVSIRPILSIPGIRAAVGIGKAVAVSPIIGGTAIRGPAAKMYRELGIRPSALAVAEDYQEVASAFVLDVVDASLEKQIQDLGLRTLVARTLMRTNTDRRRLAAARARLLAGNQEMTIWAIVPVKPLRHGKSRLAGALNEQERTALNRLLLERTLKTLIDLEEVQEVLVVSRDSSALALARELGARTVQEDGAPALNTALKRATVVAQVYASRGVLVIPADLPLMTRTDVLALIERATDPPVVVIAPDRRKKGTNALLLAPSNLIEYDFGGESFRRHCERARRVGARLEIVDLPALGLDLDLPDDLELVRHLQGMPSV